MLSMRSGTCRTVYVKSNMHRFLTLTVTVNGKTVWSKGNGARKISFYLISLDHTTTATDCAVRDPKHHAHRSRVYVMIFRTTARRYWMAGQNHHLSFVWRTPSALCRYYTHIRWLYSFHIKRFTLFVIMMVYIVSEIEQFKFMHGNGAVVCNLWCVFTRLW